MDQELSSWFYEHQIDIQRRWWEGARQAGLVSEKPLEQLAQEDAVAPGSFRSRLLAALAAGEPPDPDWLDSLTGELKQSDWAALLSALRQTLLEFLLEHAAPEGSEAGFSLGPGHTDETAMERWRVLNRRIDRIGLAMAAAFEARADEFHAEREHWQTLYNLTRELSASIDLGYVLQKAITRILGVLDADRGAVLLLDPVTERVTSQIAQDCSDVSLSLSDFPSEWQRGHGGPLILTASDSDEHTLGVLVDALTETVVVAPLLANGQFQGVLTVATTDADGFDQRQLDLVEAVVSNIAANLGNSQVIQTLNDQARELGLLLRHQQEESSQRQSILASIADGVVVNDRDGRIILVNRAAELILNTSAPNLIGRDLQGLFELFKTGGREVILKAMMAILSNPRSEIAADAAQSTLEIDDRIINARLAPVITEHNDFLGIVTIFRDITREVEADRAKSEFVSTVSHELRTPMTAIKGYTDLVFSGSVGKINDTQKRFLGIIKSNTDRLTALINDLLDISRIETGRVRFEPQPVKLGEIIKNVIEALAPSAESKEQALKYRIEAGLPEVSGDPNRLNQVFTNLVGNAINYTPEGGEISVDVYRVGGAIRADVKDNGIGVRPEEQGKIFERFYRADHPMVQECRGTGLGLPIVKMFLEMHGGRVWVESELGQGSIFTALLPLLVEEQREEDLEQIWTQAAIKLGRRVILLADDDPDIAELFQLHLERAGYKVIVVGRGVKVLEVARRYKPDLIVLDILLPDMDGRAVLEALKSEPTTADIPVLILSIIADDGAVFDLGAAGYLSKPVDENELLQAVQAAFARRGRVLVVEDDVDTIELMRVALRRVGYTVDVAAEGYEALSLARRWRPQVILLDLRLPGMDGYEALSHLKRSPATQDIPIVVTSAHVADPEKEVKRFKELGVVSFLPKPFTVKGLVAEIDRVSAAVEHARERADRSGVPAASALGSTSD